MKFTDKQLNKLQDIYANKLGREISEQEARNIGRDIVNLIESTYLFDN